jgi:hypothetical protein
MHILMLYKIGQEVVGNSINACLAEYSLRESVSAQGREGRGFDSDPGRN